MGTNVNTVTCPKCGADVQIIAYGGGWVAAHCGRVVYNSQDKPTKEGEENGTDSL